MSSNSLKFDLAVGNNAAHSELKTFPKELYFKDYRVRFHFFFQDSRNLKRQQPRIQHKLMLYYNPDQLLNLSSSSSSCRAASTGIPDPLSPLLPIIHRLREVFRVTSCVLT